MYWFFSVDELSFLFFPRTNHFSLRLTSLSITLMLQFRWHPIQNWPEKQKSTDYFPDLLLLKWIVLHLSMAFCLTGYVCQLAFVRARKKKKKKNQERERRRKASLCQMLTCHWEETKERARGFRAAKSPLLCLHLIFLHYSVHLHGRYISSGASKLG